MLVYAAPLALVCSTTGGNGHTFASDASAVFY
jgi:hypothetical protein